MKRIIAVILILIALFSFVGCTNSNNPKPIVVETRTEKSTEKTGTYSVYRCYRESNYIDFLNNLDESKYEIVNISATIDADYGDYYVVTYRVK